MGEQPQGMQLVRVGNEGPYSPGNCLWASRAESSRNKRTNRWATAFGKTQCVTDWEREIGISTGSVSARIKRGMASSIDESLGYFIAKYNYSGCPEAA